jgi:hypothetical protein
MTHKLTDELRQALGQSGGPLEVRDEESQKVYVISELGVFQRAMQALQTQENHAAIQSGIDAMHAGDLITLDELDSRIRSRLTSR